jgi:hypothetical protein
VPYRDSHRRGQEPAPIDLSKLDMEDLMNVKVTSVSKREQSLARTVGKPIRPRELASVLERWGKPWPEATASLLALAERSAALAERSAAVVLPVVK